MIEIPIYELVAIFGVGVLVSATLVTSIILIIYDLHREKKEGKKLK